MVWMSFEYLIQALAEHCMSLDQHMDEERSSHSLLVAQLNFFLEIGLQVDERLYTVPIIRMAW